MKYKVRDAKDGSLTGEITSATPAEEGYLYKGGKVVTVHHDRALGEGVIYVRKAKESS